MDIVYVKGLEVETVIGIYDWERRIRQRVVLDLEMGTDIRAAAASEDIEQTLNYKTVSKRLAAFIGESEFQLVETMAESIAELVLREFPVPWLRLRLGKPGAVTGAEDVGVIIERGARP
ncbi:dihydroneopterin aldolase [Motiliproteus sp. SC1-56]|uniref:dihydroneopterin aldolase n=1 Tax=Motiliproteus sp. SC1-56 TaxID=2799565 RepID=UPI001A8CCD88|nr:dihydroneopterin aldolase [Motiliproteus sp. SC1-56]